MSTTETTLPTWDEMSDLDKGAALMHAWKRDWEGAVYAVDNYPAEYLEDPVLMRLDAREACRHAARVTRGWQDWDVDEFQRLYDAALDASRVHVPDWAGWNQGDPEPNCRARVDPNGLAAVVLTPLVAEAHAASLRTTEQESSDV
jgi:hypothetical protein